MLSGNFLKPGAERTTQQVSGSVVHKGAVAVADKGVQGEYGGEGGQNTTARQWGPAGASERPGYLSPHGSIRVTCHPSALPIILVLGQASQVFWHPCPTEATGRGGVDDRKVTHREARPQK